MAVVDVTGRLTNGWERLACAAQELGLRILLNEVAVVAETADVTLDPLLAEPVALVFATHEPGEEFRGPRGSESGAWVIVLRGSGPAGRSVGRRMSGTGPYCRGGAW